MTQAILEQPQTEPLLNESTCRLHLRPAVELTDDQYFALCQINSELRLERTAEGDLIIMPLTGAETGNRNSEISRQLGNWAKADGCGAPFDSSTGFKLPNGADRSPDAAWVLRTRLAELTTEQKRKFLPLAPDFAIELKSPTDRLADQLAKMEEYQECGVRLGWLINPETRRVHIYRTGKEVETLEDPLEVSGEPELPGFVLDLREIWEPNI
jgi:Uma2 family endonuclease